MRGLFSEFCRIVAAPKVAGKRLPGICFNNFWNRQNKPLTRRISETIDQNG
jgi:hypothetical protein